MIALRPYQQRARDLARAAYSSGARAILYVAPTGAGKTVILGDTLTAHVKHHRDPRVNVYAHRRELLEQAARTFRAFGHEVGIFGEGAHHRVQVCSTPGALARGEVSACTLAIFDEAHHYASDEWGTVLDAHRQSGAIVCGATATPERGDGRGLDKFQHLVVVAQPRELVALGALVPCEVIKPARAVPKGKVAQSPAAAYKRYAPGRRAVVFAPNVVAGLAFLQDFLDAGVKAEIVHGGLDMATRDQVLRWFAGGTLRVLVNVMVLTEGWDCPAADVAILARDCGSTGLFLQIAGRIMRPSPGKRDCLLIDLRGASLVHGHPQDDRTYSLEGLGISAGSGTGLGAAERLCKICKAPLDDALVCSRCGRDHALSPPTSAEIELERWAFKRAESETDRARQLARWFAKFPNRKPYFYIARFRHVYGCTPPVEVWKAAKEMRS